MLRVLKHSADLGYPEIRSRLESLASQHNSELISIGRSVLGNELWTIRLGWGARSVYVNGAHHGCEWLTSPLLLDFCEEYLQALEEGAPLYGIDVPAYSSRTAIWITPMVNPDGVTLAREGLSDVPKEYRAALEKWNHGSSNFREWKANIRGVDLNRQYRADWQQAYNKGPKTPAPRYYAGGHPESEPESKAVADFTRKLAPEFIVAYHSQGEVIYWNYKHLAPPEARRIAREFSRLSGYSLVGSNPDEAGSGGYKDWYINEFSRPGFTVEIGLGLNPLPVSQYAVIKQKNLPLLASLAQLAI